MQYTCLDIQEKVQETLQADPVLAAYVKKFDIGDENVSRKLFPYVTVTSVTEQMEALCMGPGAQDLYRYRIVIKGGASSIAGNVALLGSDTQKGIIQLTDDLITALYPNSLDGLVKHTLRLESAFMETKKGTGGNVWTTTVILTGILKK